MKNMFDDGFKFSVKWTIPINKFHRIENGCFCRSNIMQANLPGVLYTLRCYPKGDSEKSKNKVGIFLVLSMGMMKSVRCEFTFNIKACTFSKHFNTTFSPTSTTWGCNLHDTEKLSNSEFDDEIMIEVEGMMKGWEMKLFEPIRCPIIQKMWDRTDKDVTIFTKDGKIKAHKGILKNSSHVFVNILKSTDIIEITEFSHATVQTAIRFWYDIDITSEITDSIIDELLTFSNNFKMGLLKKTVESVLIQKISDDTVTHVSNLSVKFDAKNLRECCICYLLLKKDNTQVSKISKFFGQMNAKIKPKTVSEYLVKKKIEDPLGIKDIHDLNKEICDEIIDRSFVGRESIQQSF